MDGLTSSPWLKPYLLRSLSAHSSPPSLNACYLHVLTTPSPRRLLLLFDGHHVARAVLTPACAADLDADPDDLGVTTRNLVGALLAPVRARVRPHPAVAPPRALLVLDSVRVFSTWRTQRPVHPAFVDADPQVRAALRAAVGFALAAYATYSSFERGVCMRGGDQVPDEAFEDIVDDPALPPPELLADVGAFGVHIPEVGEKGTEGVEGAEKEKAQSDGRAMGNALDGTREPEEEDDAMPTLNTLSQEEVAEKERARTGEDRVAIQEDPPAPVALAGQKTDDADASARNSEAAADAEGKRTAPAGGDKSDANSDAAEVDASMPDWEINFGSQDNAVGAVLEEMPQTQHFAEDDEDDEDDEEDEGSARDGGKGASAATAEGDGVKEGSAPVGAALAGDVRSDVANEASSVDASKVQDTVTGVTEYAEEDKGADVRALGSESGPSAVGVGEATGAGATAASVDNDRASNKVVKGVSNARITTSVEVVKSKVVETETRVASGPSGGVAATEQTEVTQIVNSAKKGSAIRASESKSTVNEGEGDSWQDSTVRAVTLVTTNVEVEAIAPDRVENLVKCAPAAEGRASKSGDGSRACPGEEAEAANVSDEATEEGHAGAGATDAEKLEKPGGGVDEQRKETRRAQEAASGSKNGRADHSVQDNNESGASPSGVRQGKVGEKVKPETTGVKSDASIKRGEASKLQEAAEASNRHQTRKGASLQPPAPYSQPDSAMPGERRQGSPSEDGDGVDPIGRKGMKRNASQVDGNDSKRRKEEGEDARVAGARRAAVLKLENELEEMRRFRGAVDRNPIGFIMMPDAFLPSTKGSRKRPRSAPESYVKCPAPQVSMIEQEVGPLGTNVPESAPM